MAINAEVTDYVSRIATASGTIYQATIDAHDVFVAAAKTHGYFSKLALISTMAGDQLAAALVNLVAPTGLKTLTNVNMVGADYVPTGGFVLTSNTTKYLDTGFIPDSQSLSSQNISAGVFVSRDVSGSTGSSYMIGNNPASGTSTLFFGNNGNGGRGVGIGSSFKSHPSGIGFSALSSQVSGTVSYCNGERIGPLTSSVLSLSTSITLFSSTANATRRYSYAGIGFFFIGSYLTQQEQRDLALDVDALMIALGRGDSRDRSLHFGDSITQGVGATVPTTAVPSVNRWSRIVANNLNLREANFGISSSRLRPSLEDPYSGWSRRDDLAIYSNASASRLIISYGVNDWSQDTNISGDDTITADYAVKLGTVIDEAIARGVLRKNITLCSISYATTGLSQPSTTAKAQKYIDAAHAVAVAKKVRWADLYTAMVSAGGATLLADGLHPNDAGHTVIADTIIAAPLTDSAAPSVPVLTATPQDGAVILSVTAPADSDVAGVKFYRAGVQIADLTATAGQAVTYTDTGLVNGNSYSYTATAYDVVLNESAPTGAVSAVPSKFTSYDLARIASSILANPNNKLATDASGKVTATNGITIV